MSNLKAEFWPSDIPFNDETLDEAQKTHDVYFIENNYALPIIEDPDQDQWTDTISAGASYPAKHREQLREMGHKVPLAKRVLDLCVYYILGGMPEVVLSPIDSEEPPTNQLIKRANKKLKRELKNLAKHLSFSEMFRRAYRDGEAFIRRIPNTPPDYRFCDPEDICDEDGNEAGGVITKPDDSVSIEHYILSRQKYTSIGTPDGFETYDTVDAADMVHVKIDCDSNEKRGRSRLLACEPDLRKYRNLLISEVTLRHSQSNIVMVRKVAGGSAPTRRIMDAAKTTNNDSPQDNYSGIERNRPGTVVNTSKGVEISFAHPDNNFSDAGPLLNTLIRQGSRTTGFSFEMLSCDTSDGSLASALVAESPVIQMINEERAFWQVQLEPFFMWLLDGLPINWEDYEVLIKFRNVETKDGLKNAQTLNLGVMGNAVSRKEMSREMGYDPEKMRAEIEEESKLDYVNPNYANQNPDAAAKGASSAGNASASGTNQGDKPKAGSADPAKQGAKEI